MEAITPREAAKLGLSRTGFYRAAHSGRFEKIGRGLYRREDAAVTDLDWIEAAARRNDATICLTSALAYYDLIDTIPDALDIAIPRGSRIPAGSHAISWHLFDKATFALGRTEIAIPGSEMQIGIYTPERCLVDAYRLRGDTGYELGRDALRAWLERGGEPAPLLSLAETIPRAKAPLLTALEVLA